MEVPRSSEIFRILIFCKLPLNNYVELSRRLAWYLSNFAFAPQSLNSTLCISLQNPGNFLTVFLFLCGISSWFFLSLSCFGIVIIITISIVIFITITIIIIIIIIIMNNTTAVVVTLVALKKIPSFAKLMSKQTWLNTPNSNEVRENIPVSQQCGVLNKLLNVFHLSELT